MKFNRTAPAVSISLDDKSRLIFRADQNAIYELEETTGIPVAAWLVGYGEDVVEALPERTVEGKALPPFQVRRRGRILELAWACSASWREDQAPEMTPGQLRSLLPTGKDWEKFARDLQGIFDECLMGPDASPTPAPLETSGADQAAAPTGEADSLQAASSST